MADSGHKTFTISPVWDIDKDDVQQLVHFAEEKSNFFRYPAPRCSYVTHHTFTVYLFGVWVL